MIVMPTPGQIAGQAAVGVHYSVTIGIHGFPLEFIPFYVRDGSDKLMHYPARV